MRIRYQYTNYPYSKAATSWSGFRSLLATLGIFVVMLLVIGINLLLKSLLGGTDRYTVSFILAIAIFAGFLFFCKHREEVCAACDFEKERLGRELTADEKKQAWAAAVQQKKEAKNNTGR